MSIAIVTAAIWLWVDVMFAWSEGEPVKARHVVCVFVLMVAIALRIVQRLLNGTL